MSELKNTFLHKELWILTFGAAFQRSNVYKKNIPETFRKNYRTMLSEYVENVILPKYKKEISEEQHIENIFLIIKFSESYESMLNDGKMNLGISQKLLNLHLKYLWCLGEITIPPPHFPLDRIIQQKSIRNRPIISWTQIKDVETYLSIINQAREKATAQNKSLAQWELENYSRNGL